MKKPSISYVDFMLLLVALIWGTNPVVVKIGLGYVPVLPYTVLRLVFGAMFSWIILYLTKTYRSFDREDYKKILIVSLGGFFLFQLFYTIGIDMSTSGNAALILAILPVSVAIINKIFNIEDITLQMTIGILFSFIGVAIVVVASGKELSIFNKYIIGTVFLLIAEFGYGYYTVFTKELLGKYSHYQIITFTLTICSIAFIPISIKSVTKIDWSSLPIHFWLGNLYSGIVSISIANSIWTWGIGKIGSTRTSLYNNFTPVFALITGYFVLGEVLRYLQLVGIVILFIGLYLTRTNKSIFKRNLYIKDSNNN